MIDDLDMILGELKNGVDLVDVVSDTVNLRRAGPDRYVGICPLHAERTGSLSVNRKKQLWYCFGCNAGGDIVTWVRELEGLPFWPALRKLADRIGMDLPEPIHGRRDPVPPLELTELPAAYRAHPYVLLVEAGADLEGITSPVVKLGEPVLTARAALRLEKLQERVCLVYTDTEAALQSVRNVYAACRMLSLYLRPVDEGDTVRQLVFREWPDELWRKARPGMLVLIRHELRRLGWTLGAAAVSSIRSEPLWQHVMLRACRDNADVIPDEDQVATPSRLEAELLARLVPGPRSVEELALDRDDDLELLSPVWGE